ncbi:MAG: hypothetical protein BJ554DRAFT_6158 [Olpidium bornovanus]|uniref:Uncharacterized protein n=1 Tax=Olpidium bornovanus TaxID=278681 RepID=A0A8H7ZY80_9FUNG|nr:MAG: hypothetical protein BJ554DRAFT_6158 [Olpidium bornovanus]
MSSRCAVFVEQGNEFFPIFSNEKNPQRRPLCSANRNRSPVIDRGADVVIWNRISRTGLKQFLSFQQKKKAAANAAEASQNAPITQ